MRRWWLVSLLLAPAVMAQVPSPRPKADAGPSSWTNGPYQYDGSGNITSIGSESYVYDKLGRLKTATLRGPDMSAMQTQSFGYDVYGNLISTSKLGQTVPLPTSTLSNRMDSLSYDASGNVTAAGTVQYAYDAVGMLNAVRVGSSPQPRIIYAYTADDERLLAFDVSTGVTHWTLRGMDNKVLRDFKQQGSIWSVDRDYVYRDGLLLAALKSAGAVEHYTLDHLGTPRLITDATGHKIGYHVYWPFGEEWTPGTAQEAAPLRFTAHERDADPSGGTAPLDYMHARYYGAGWGRFLAVDSAADLDMSTSLPQRWNAYTYALNNPVRLVDPDGAAPAPFQKGITKVIGQYMFHFDWTHGGLHIDVSVSTGGKNWRGLGRLGKMLEPIEHAGETPNIPRAAINALLKNRGKLGAKANKALASLLEKETASAAGKAGANFVGGAVAIAIDLAITDKLNAQDDRALMKIETDVLKKHFGGRTVDKLSDEEREQYFEMVNEQNAAAKDSGS